MKLRNLAVATFAISTLLTCASCGQENIQTGRNLVGNKVEETIQAQMVMDEQSPDQVGENKDSEGGEEDIDGQGVDEANPQEPPTAPQTGLNVTDLQSPVSSVGNQSQYIPVLTPEQIKDASGEEYDIDLVGMGKEMVYASVLNILNAPNSYVGTTIRMEGIIRYSHNEDGSKTYANVVIQDALACCANGFEFQWGKDGEHACPEDYPTEGTKVTVIGTLETYLEDGQPYFRCGNAEMSVMEQ